MTDPHWLPILPQAKPHAAFEGHVRQDGTMLLLFWRTDLKRALWYWELRRPTARGTAFVRLADSPRRPPAPFRTAEELLSALPK